MIPILLFFLMLKRGQRSIHLSLGLHQWGIEGYSACKIEGHQDCSLDYSVHDIVKGMRLEGDGWMDGDILQYT